jgi:hypothetical protein
MLCQKLKVSCLVFFRAEGTIEPTAEILSRENGTNPLIWEFMLIYTTRQFSLRLCHKTHLYLTIWHSTVGKTH